MLAGVAQDPATGTANPILMPCTLCAPAAEARISGGADQWFTCPMDDSGDLIDGLRRIGVRYGGAPAEVLPTRPDVIIVRAGSVVVKAHAPGAEEAPLVERMRAVAHPALRGIMLGPVTEEVMVVRDRLVTVWPAGVPVDHDAPDAAPWEESARLLARLHAVPAGALPPLPAAGGPARVGTTVARLTGDSAAERVVRRAMACLPPLDAGPRSTTHGDWHMGQLVRTGDGWILIDVDDLGVGDPAWDLARPAAWFAAGLLDPEVWHRFLGAYRAAGARRRSRRRPVGTAGSAGSGDDRAADGGRAGQRGAGGTAAGRGRAGAARHLREDYPAPKRMPQCAHRVGCD